MVKILNEQMNEWLQDLNIELSLPMTQKPQYLTLHYHDVFTNVF